MKTVICDTNFIIECATHKIDIHSELDRILDHNFIVGILDRTLDELDSVIARGRKIGTAAKLAKTILMTKKVTIYPTSGGHVDKLLLEKADDSHLIATMDKDLKRKLKKKGYSVVIIRGKKRLALDEA